MLERCLSGGSDMLPHFLAQVIPSVSAWVWGSVLTNLKAWSWDPISFLLELSLVMQGISMIFTLSVPFISQEDGHILVCCCQVWQKKSMEERGMWKGLLFIGLQTL